MLLTRRWLLGTGAAVIALGGISVPLLNRKNSAELRAESNDFYRSLPMPEFIDARKLGNNVELKAQEGMTEVVPGYSTPTYGYSSTYLGPVIQVQRGDAVTMNITNGLDKPTTVHWHGLFVPSEFDGGPFGVIEPGQTWNPTLHINQPASTAWYHPHPHGDTGRQVYTGLAGMIYIEDGSTKDLGLPTRYGIDDFPIIIQDRFFTADGDMIYDSSPMAVLHGARGNTIIVNGMYGPVAEVPKGVVRLRLLNGANARNFRLVFDDYRLMHVVANDNGLLAKSVPVTELTISPGERYEVLVDFSNGVVSALLTYPDHSGRPATGLSDTVNAMVTDIKDILKPVMRFDPVDELSVVTKSVPEKLVDLPSLVVPDGIKRRTFILDSMTAANAQFSGGGQAMEGMDHTQMNMSMDMDAKSGIAMGMKMGINGKTYDASRIDTELKLGDKEIWELRGTEMAHPFHVHGASFRILNLDGAPPPEHLTGQKDTVLVNELAQILITFDQPAKAEKPFMYHCHILEHEDAGMMAQYVAT